MTSDEGGISNDALVQPYLSESAISYAGSVLKYGSAAGSCALCGAGEKPMGISFATTKNPITGVAAANKTIGVISLVNGLEVNIKLLATNAEIAYGDSLETTAAGTVDKKSGAGYIVAEALEAIAANTGGWIRARINYRYEAS